ANLLNLAGDPCDFDTIPNCNWPLRENDQAADEVARDILETESDTDTDCTRENCQGSEMNACIIQNDKNADDQYNIANDLRNRVLERAVEAALGEKAIKEEMFGSGRNPEDRDQQGNQEENLN